MRKAMVAGNWKLNGSNESVRALSSQIVEALPADLSVDVVVCPTFVHLHRVYASIAGSSVKLGAQNVSIEPEGAYTGEVSASMLSESGCRYVIVGHSERRALYGESDADVGQKFTAVQRAGMTPILCLGEHLQEREGGYTERVIARQLGAVIEVYGAAVLNNAVIAYEPVWAIGTGKTATPDQAQAVHSFARARIASLDEGVAAGVRILYGGSVKPDNAAALFAMADIDGGLVGGAALNSSDFVSICQAA